MKQICSFFEIAQYTMQNKFELMNFIDIIIIIIIIILIIRKWSGVEKIEPALVQRE